MLSSHIFPPLDHVLHWVGVQEDVNIQSCLVFDVIQPHISPIGSCPALSRSPGGRQHTVVFSIWCYPATYFSHWIMSCIESESRRTSTYSRVQYLMLSSHIFPPLDHVLHWVGVQEDVNRQSCSVFDVIPPHISPIGSCPALNRSPGGRQQTDVFSIWCYPATYFPHWIMSCVVSESRRTSTDRCVQYLMLSSHIFPPLDHVLRWIGVQEDVNRQMCSVFDVIHPHPSYHSSSSIMLCLGDAVMSEFASIHRWRPFLHSLQDWLFGYSHAVDGLRRVCLPYEIFKIPLNHYMYVSAFRVQLSQSYINIANVRLLHSLYLVDVEVLFVFHSSFICATSAIANPTLARICS